MKATVILKDLDNFDYLIDLIDEVRTEDQVHQVDIKPYKPVLSANQRRLYWLWIEHIMNHTGYTKEELHLRYKKDYLVNIFERDDQDYAKMIESVRVVHRKGMRGHAKHLADMIVKMTSIMDATTAQMTEYLNLIQQECIDRLQLQLPIPGDIARF